MVRCRRTGGPFCATALKRTCAIFDVGCSSVADTLESAGLAPTLDGARMVTPPSGGRKAAPHRRANGEMYELPWPVQARLGLALAPPLPSPRRPEIVTYQPC